MIQGIWPALLVLFLNRRFCGSDPIENVVYSFVQDAGRVNVGDKVLLQLYFHVLLYSGVYAGLLDTLS